MEQKSGWQFALVNGKLAEVHFENGKIWGFCYVKESEYKTKQEKKWIASDTKNCRLVYRKGVYRDALTGKKVPELSAREFKKRLRGPFYTWDAATGKFKKIKKSK